MRKGFKSVLLDVKQSTLETWIQKLKALVSEKERQLVMEREAEEKKMQLLPMLKDARDKGITLREISEITGLSHATIARWLNPEKYKYKPRSSKKEVEVHA